MEDKLFSVQDKICIVTGGLGQLGKNYVRELHRMANMGLGILYLDTPEYQALCDATAADMKMVCEKLGLSQ